MHLLLYALGAIFFVVGLYFNGVGSGYSEWAAAWTLFGLSLQSAIVGYAIQRIEWRDRPEQNSVTPLRDDK